MPVANYDVDQIVREFLRWKFPERADLVKEMSAAIRDSGAVRGLTIEIGQAAVENRQTPAQLIQNGLMYGMVLGILMERERRTRIIH